MSDLHEDLPTFAGAEASAAAARAPQTSIGKVGRYKITRLIGEGGMGAVYEAEQDQPRRTVALKVIKPGLASPELLRRFAQESQALGRLQHPGIAQIYDAGTADTGYGPQPYFAMEFIRGEGLRDYAESHHLNTRQRLEIVVKVCEAVHHAHQRGLIHRDLKPGNILVDETGQPKILDFGVARVTDSDAQATMQTDVGQLVGTLAYMSPEQVLADPLEIDIRSDVYALGVILYELLAGRLPYNISKKLHEALNTIREEDPSKLSSISRTYRGDIETIAAKALEKDKTRRYASAAELGADITHYLKDEPIVAQPPSTSYQLKKFARRNKALVMGIAAVFVVLLLGAVVSAYQAVRATRAEKAAVLDRDRAETAGKAAAEAAAAALVAKGEAEAAEIRATKDRDDAIEQKLRADTEAATAKAVSEFMQKNLFEQVTGGPGASTSDLSVSVALDRAASKIDGAFEKSPLVEAGVREAVASAYVTLALADRAATQAERALALRRRVQGDEDKETLKTMHLLGNVNRVRRNYAEGERLLTRVVAISTRKFGRDHADTLASALDLAYLYLLDQKFDEAARYALAAAEGRRRTLGAGHKDTINASLILSRAHEARKDLPQALKWATSAHDSSRRAFGEADSLTLAAASVRQEINLKMTPNAPTNAAARAELFDNATRALDSITATSLPAMIDLAIRRANVAVQQNKPEDAVPPLVEAIDAARRAGQEDLMLSAFLGGVYALQKKFTEAEATLRPVLAKPEAWNGLGNLLPFALRSLATNYRDVGKFAEAELYLLKLVPFVRVTPGEGTQQTRVDMFLLADNYSSQRKYAEAERAYTELLDVQRRVAAPEGINTLSTIANIGWVRLQQKRYAEAEKSFRDSLAILVRTNATSWERFNVDSMLGATLAAQRKFDEAEPLLIAGHEGMKTAQRATNAANTSRFTQDQAGEAIVQLYADWGKPAKQAEWNAKIKATP
jgi:hypothetical protein